MTVTNPSTAQTAPRASAAQVIASTAASTVNSLPRPSRCGISMDHTPATRPSPSTPIITDVRIHVFEAGTDSSSEPAGLREQADRLREAAWPGGGGHDPALHPVAMLLEDGGAVLAALDILRKEITYGGERLAAGGLSAVVTAASARRRGYGRRLVAAARDEMRALGLDAGIFTCDRPLRPFYEAAGWRVLPGTVLVGGTPDAPLASDAPGFDKVTMGEFFDTRAAVLLGARVPLYPGSIDRLW